MRRLTVVSIGLPLALLVLLLAAFFLSWSVQSGDQRQRDLPRDLVGRISGPEAVARVLSVASMGISDFALRQHIRPKVIGVYLTTKRLAPWRRGATLSRGHGVPAGAPVWVIKIRVPWDTRIGDGRMRRGVVYQRRTMRTGILDVHVDARRASRGIVFIAPYRTPPGPLFTRVEIAFMALNSAAVTAPWGRGGALAGPTLDEALLRKNGPSDRTQLLGYQNQYVKAGSPDTWVWRVRVKGPFRVEAGNLRGPAPRSARSRAGRWATIETVSWFLDARRRGRGILGGGYSGPRPAE